jgi:Holliday junction DNA helicase RuvB
VEHVVSPNVLSEEGALDGSLRPRSLEHFIGQRDIRRNLKIFTEAAKARVEGYCCGTCGVSERAE